MGLNTFKSNCATCRALKVNAKLRTRVRFAAFKREEGDETLADIAREIKIAVPGIYNHAKKHMIDYSPMVERREQVIIAKKQAVFQAQANKKLEVAFDQKDLEITENYEDGLDEYIRQGGDALNKGNMKITEKGFLAAIKIKSDIQSKKRGQDIEIMKAVYSFSSGKNKKINEELASEITPSDAEGSDTGADESDSIYRAVTRNAPTRRPKEVHTGTG